MARKKMRKFAGGGDFSASDEIVVRGQRPMQEISTFDLSRIGGSGGMGGGLGSGMAAIDGGGGGGGRGGMSSQRMGVLTPPPEPARNRLPITPAVIRQQASTLANLMGDKGAKAYGAKGSFRFKEGGKAKPKKMAKGGSTASKRADGCATKGKTKGRFV